MTYSEKEALARVAAKIPFWEWITQEHITWLNEEQLRAWVVLWHFAEDYRAPHFRFTPTSPAPSSARFNAGYFDMEDDSADRGQPESVCETSFAGEWFLLDAALRPLSLGTGRLTFSTSMRSPSASYLGDRQIGLLEVDRMDANCWIRSTEYENFFAPKSYPQAANWFVDVQTRPIRNFGNDHYCGPSLSFAAWALELTRTSEEVRPAARPADRRFELTLERPGPNVASVAALLAPRMLRTIDEIEQLLDAANEEAPLLVERSASLGALFEVLEPLAEIGADVSLNRVE
jgi:hypothetical protein